MNTPGEDTHIGSPVIPVFKEPGEKHPGVAEVVSMAKAAQGVDVKPTAHQRTMAELQYASVRQTAADRFPVALVVDARGVTTEAALAEFERGVTQVRVQARALIQLEEQRAAEAAAHARKAAGGE